LPLTSTKRAAFFGTVAVLHSLLVGGRGTPFLFLFGNQRQVNPSPERITPTINLGTSFSLVQAYICTTPSLGETGDKTFILSLESELYNYGKKLERPWPMISSGF